MRPKGVPLRTPFWHETVLFKTVIGLKWIIWGVRKNWFGSDEAKMRPKGVPLRIPFGMKPFCSKL